MKTTKTTKMALCGAIVALLGMAFVACGTGAPARPADELVSVPLPILDWTVLDDQGPPDHGTSTIEMTEFEVDGMRAWHFAGEVTDAFQWGYAGFGLFDMEGSMLELIQSMGAISFMVRGDGQRYLLQVLTSAVRDYAHFAVAFETVANEAIRINLPLRNFFQPAWGVPVGRLRPETISGLQWMTHESWRPGSYELAIWDVRLYVPAEMAALAGEAQAALLAAPVEEEVENGYGEYQY